MNTTRLIQVNDYNVAIGEIDKLDAHVNGVLHRAFSVFVFNGEGKWLLQRRAIMKYHSGGLWTNACCGHPQLGEDAAAAATERLRFEMGLHCLPESTFDFKYYAVLDNGLIEHEYDHVYLATTDELPVINPDEVSDWRYITFDELEKEIELSPGSFTEWFKMIYKKVNTCYLEKSKS